MHAKLSGALVPSYILVLLLATFPYSPLPLVGSAMYFSVQITLLTFFRPSLYSALKVPCEGHLINDAFLVLLEEVILSFSAYQKHFFISPLGNISLQLGNLAQHLGNISSFNWCDNYFNKLLIQLKLFPTLMVFSYHRNSFRLKIISYLYRFPVRSDRR